MAIKERVYSVDDVWRMTCAAENETIRYELLDGELIVTMSPGWMHSRLASEIARLMGNYAVERDLGDVTVESGHYSPFDRGTLLLPDVAFTRRECAPAPNLAPFAPMMPDLAVEIVSPSQSIAQIRRKARVYLSHAVTMVWILRPKAQSAEVWTVATDGLPRGVTIDVDGELPGGTLLPGFNLPLKALFRPKEK